ncbi:RNA polymerase sigma-70 factor (sigma-E family) [Kitasatospora sp. GAS204A]|uniref:SigE family RNA polymerase sigma factor n=1 Tax=unclassified Kitasatospora TaxID=2633591 RepID=UPI0024751876|nr:SigE family RNA polymerase sigma factor [Kitasatospora sp. GAS204B]MDH6119534.1 RNA polymerase sigma-70 factor (sigma-E family) [Kitasatospora sp. GAS204B]
MTKSSSSAREAMEDEFLAFAAGRSGQLYRSAYFLTGGDGHLAEDLVQETLGRMYAHWHRTTRPGRSGQIADPAAYAQTVLVRQFLSHQRRRSNRERPAAVLPDRTGHEVDASLRITLTEALAQLPAKDRAVLVLRYWEDRSVEETATVLRANAGAVRTRSVRALARLRVLLGDSLAELAVR